jgi:hypothetical protein
MAIPHGAILRGAMLAEVDESVRQQPDHLVASRQTMMTM